MAVRRHEVQNNTRSAILDSAERLVQSRGFNGFSYADVAAELGITKAALHYHFPGKAELGAALLDRYSIRFAHALLAIDASNASAPTKLAAYTDLYLGVLRDERMCLCGMLAAEYRTLPDAMREGLITFFDDNYAWLARLLTAGTTEGSIQTSLAPQDAARMIVGALEGAMLVARPYGDSRQFEAVAAGLVAQFTKPASAARRRRASSSDAEHR